MHQTGREEKGLAKGTYALVLHLSEPRQIGVGRLGEFLFPAGYYVYVGSALGGLEHRIARHLRRGKVLRWHIDYLREYAEVVQVWSTSEKERLECQWMRAVCKMSGATIVVSRFGASDCRCRTHLAYFAHLPDLSVLNAEVQVTEPASS